MKKHLDKPTAAERLPLFFKNFIYSKNLFTGNVAAPLLWRGVGVRSTQWNK